MITVIYDEDEKIFRAKGSFKLGIAGVFKNESYTDEAISFDNELLESIRERDEEWVGPLLPFIKSDDPNEIAKNLAEYYNELEKRVAENEKQINDCILCNLFENMEGCGYPFWELDGLVSKEFLKEHNPDEEDFDELIYGDEQISRFLDFFDESPNNGTVEKPDIEAEIRKLYPMFELDKFIEKIKPEVLYFKGRFFSFQFSDGWHGELACGAYDELDENFTFTDWHNH